MGTAKTSLGEPTLATVGTAPETPMVEEKPKRISHTSDGRRWKRLNTVSLMVFLRWATTVMT